ncbi:hypothetical protein GJAV_G00205270 [Gymnothorax javanicus]|nr:hypothetical protein GJAV_G00205270 [Gymnothorax javanicus]
MHRIDSPCCYQWQLTGARGLKLFINCPPPSPSPTLYPCSSATATPVAMVMQAQRLDRSSPSLRAQLEGGRTGAGLCFLTLCAKLKLLSPVEGVHPSLHLSRP